MLESNPGPFDDMPTRSPPRHQFLYMLKFDLHVNDQRLREREGERERNREKEMPQKDLSFKTRQLCFVYYVHGLSMNNLSVGVIK